MKFQYASDLHLEFDENYKFLLKQNLEPVAPYLILAGDIDIISSGQVTRPDYFQFLSDNWKEVFIIPGNHEYYCNGDVGQAYSLDYKVRENVRYINHQSLIIEGVQLLFTTLWSRTNYPMIKSMISDFRQCKYDEGEFKYNHHDELHAKSLSWLKKELAKPKKYSRIGVSHFVPCKEADGYPDGDDWDSQVIKRYFVADLSYFMPNWDVDYWIYGHNHWNKNTDVFGIKFRSNQFGYSFQMEHTGFDFSKTVEL